ncbi:MAG: antitoxin [Actinomycetota bacterium]|nr:antitoxin [Actinomycetota bacterium]
MVNLGKLTKTVKQVVDTKGDKIAAGVEKATDFVDKKTQGKYRDKLEKVDTMAQKLDKTRRGPGDRPEDRPEPS